jgi:hypothetical protein
MCAPAVTAEHKDHDMSVPTLLRFCDLKERGVVRNRTQLGRLVDKAGFPAGFHLTANTRVWDETEVLEWIRSRRDAAEQQPAG